MNELASEIVLVTDVRPGDILTVPHWQTGAVLVDGTCFYVDHVDEWTSEGRPTLRILYGVGGDGNPIVRCFILDGQVERWDVHGDALDKWLHLTPIGAASQADQDQRGILPDYDSSDECFGCGSHFSDPHSPECCLAEWE